MNQGAKYLTEKEMYDSWEMILCASFNPWYIFSTIQVAIIGLYYFITLQFAYSTRLQPGPGHGDISSYPTQIRHKNETEERGGWIRANFLTLKIVFRYKRQNIVKLQHFHSADMVSVNVKTIPWFILFHSLNNKLTVCIENV